MGDPYLAGTCRWWHLTVPSPELLAAGAVGSPGVAVDLGCGLGTEIGYLAGRGWRGLGVDLSAAALAGARARHREAAFASADVTSLPLRAGTADLLLDRGCFHYLTVADRARYAREAGRVLRAGGRLLLRMCLNSAGVPNGLDEGTIRATCPRISSRCDDRQTSAVMADTIELTTACVRRSDESGYDTMRRRRRATRQGGSDGDWDAACETPA